MAYVNASLGREALDELLIVAREDLDKPCLQEAAAELKALGLVELAKHITKAARRAPLPTEPPTYWEQRAARRR